MKANWTQKDTVETSCTVIMMRKLGQSPKRRGTAKPLSCQMYPNTVLERIEGNWTIDRITLKSNTQSVIVAPTNLWQQRLKSVQNWPLKAESQTDAKNQRRSLSPKKKDLSPSGK